MDNYLRVILELLKKNPNFNLIKILLKRIDKSKFLLYCNEFPLEQIIKNLEKIEYYSYSKILKKNYLFNYILRELRIKELLKINNLFKKNKIKYILIKGLDLYNKSFLRRTSDIDLLIEKKDIYKSEKIIKKIGYFYDSKIRSKESWLSTGHHLNFYRKSNKNLIVELHWQLLQEGAPFRINYSSIWKNSKEIILNKKRIRIPCLEHTIIILSIHSLYLSTHTPYRDLYLISKILKYNKIDYKFLVKEAKAWKTENFVFISLKTVKYCFDVNIDNYILNILRGDRPQLILLKFLLLPKLNKISFKKTNLYNLLFEILITNFKNKFKIIKRELPVFIKKYVKL